MTEGKLKPLSVNGIYFLIPVFYPKNPRKRHIICKSTWFSTVVATNGFKDVKVLKKNFEPADIQVAMSILLGNRFSNIDIS
jgi:hypothetical protein